MIDVVLTIRHIEALLILIIKSLAGTGIKTKSVGFQQMKTINLIEKYK